MARVQTPFHPASLLVDYPCGHQVEIDLEDVSIRTEIRDSLELADDAHAEACAAEPRRIYRYSDNVIVRGQVGGGSRG